MPEVTFYFDLGSPFAYLAAERLEETLPEPGGTLLEPAMLLEPVHWQPVSLGALFKLTGRSSWSLGDLEHRQAGMTEVERRAQLYGLPPVRWPDPWPGNYLTAMRAVTYASRIGRGRELAVSAFRDAFQQGHDLTIPAQVLAAASDAGLDPQEVDEATHNPEIKLALREATEAAHELGVFGVPTIAVDGELFWGDDRLPDVAAYLQQAMSD